MTKAKTAKLPDLPSYSVKQLAKRWGVETSDIEDYIKTGVLTAHVQLHREPAALQTRKSSRGVALDGYYRLPVASAVRILDRHRQSYDALDVPSLEVVAKEPNTMALVEGDFLSNRPFERLEMRVLREEVERFEATITVQASSAAPALRDSQRHRERCRAVAQLLWDREPALTIEDMIRRREMTDIGQQRAVYDPTTLRNWIKDLCPNRNPGRRPKNSRAGRE